MDAHGRLTGVFLGYANQRRAAASIELTVDAAGAHWRIGRLGGGVDPVDVVSENAAVCAHETALAETVDAVAGEGTPAPVKKAAPTPVPCPECFGIQSAHCDTCEGAGVVPG